jgi:hypothetical protein
MARTSSDGADQRRCLACGHSGGDSALEAVAASLQESIRSEPDISRALAGRNLP